MTLLVTAPSGTSSSISRTINVGAPMSPTVTVAFSPTNPRAGNVVNFTATATGVNGATIDRYDWNFGGGVGLATTATGSNTATFAAATSTTYLVTVTVTDSNGTTATATVPVTVQP